MSDYQEYYDNFHIEHEGNHPEDFSTNTFGTLVWEYQQKEIDRLRKREEKLVDFAEAFSVDYLARSFSHRHASYLNSFKELLKEIEGDK